MLRDILKTLVTNKGKSQKDLAETIGVSENTISRFFSHKSDMKCGEFIELLKVAGIDLNKIARDKLYEDSLTDKQLTVFEKMRVDQRRKLVSWHSANGGKQ